MGEAKLFGAGVKQKRLRHKKGQRNLAHPNHLGQCFNVQEPNHTWVTDIIYIKTYEGWFYLAVVLDLFSRKIAGWATSHRMTTQLALKALEMAALDKSRTKKSLYTQIKAHSIAHTSGKHY